METIKYRALRKSDNVMVYGYLADYNLIKSELKSQKIEHIKDGVFRYTCNVFEVIPETVGQFTGLYDKYNKEIYTGDIILHPVYNTSVIYFSLKHAAMCYEYKQFLNKENKDYEIKQRFMDGDVLIREIEIIGNVYQNKELIK